MLSPINVKRRTYDVGNRLRGLVPKVRTYFDLWRKVPHRWAYMASLVRLRFGPWLPPAERCAILTLEFTSFCKLHCVYCQNPYGLRPGGSMSDETFRSVVRSIDEARIHRVHLSGNGEPTLHPRFGAFVGELRPRTTVLGAVSNGQWHRSEVTEAIGLLDRLDLSVAGSDKPSYESSRQGGNFDLLLDNLSALRDNRSRSRSGPLLVARLMLRPSDLEQRDRHVAFWRERADVVTCYYVGQAEPIPTQEDVFQIQADSPAPVRKCGRPFGHLVVAWDGTVPLCGPALFKDAHSHNILGNVNTQSLSDLYRSPVMRQYRAAHRRWRLGQMPRCIGCRQAG